MPGGSLASWGSHGKGPGAKGQYDIQACICLVILLRHPHACLHSSIHSALNMHPVCLAL